MQANRCHTAANPSYCLAFSKRIFCNTVIAQRFNRYYNLRHLNVENGLPDNTVYHFLQDSEGFMWLSTRNGISLFDGVRTINYQHNDQNKRTISKNFITRMFSGGKSKHTASEISFNIMKSGSDDYIMMPASRLLPGEYGFINLMVVNSGGRDAFYTVFAFGVD